MAAIFADNGTADSLSTFSRLAGNRDPARAADVNIAALAQTSELALSAGAPVALIQNTNPMPWYYGISSEWRARLNAVLAGYSNFTLLGWEWKTYVAYYALQPVLDQPPIDMVFVPTGSSTVDSLRIQMGNSGNTATTATLQFFDVANPANPVPVGNAASLYLAANAPYLTRIFAQAGAFQGFAASLVRGRRYVLRISYTKPDLNTRVTAVGTGFWNVKLDVGGFGRLFPPVTFISNGWTVTRSDAIPLLWRIDLPDGASCIPLGGRAGYQASGRAYRTLDVCANGKPAPTAHGVFSYVDSIAAGTGLSIDAWATNTPALSIIGGLADWTAIGRMTSGQSVPPYRYWRFRIDFTSNAQSDDTPRLGNISLSYMMSPILLGTHAQAVKLAAAGNAFTAIAVKAINKVSSSTAALEPRAKTIMTGKLTLELAPEPIVEQLFAHPLRGKRVVLRAGYADIPDNVLYYDGIIRDLAFDKGGYTLTIQDAIELTDVSVPRIHWPAFDNTKAYASGIKVMFNDKAYQTLQAIGAPIAPALLKNPDDASMALFWQPAPTIWQDIAYLSNTHLCDAAADLLQNQINLADEKIDLASLNEVQAQYPNRITTGRDISQPTKAIDLLSEIAWLTESYWLMREGRLSLIAEALSSDTPVMYLTPHDIKEGLQFRRGWAELKNEVIIFTGWTGSSDNKDQFRQARSIADADSAANYNIVAVQEFQDKWNVPLPELTVIAQNFLNRWKNGRRIVRIECSMRVLPLECGDVVELTSAQLPKGDNNRIKALIQGKDLNWMNQTITLTLLEI